MDDWSKTWGRRALMILAYAALWMVVVSLLPILLLLAAIADLILGNRLAIARTILIAAVFLTCELIGVWLSFFIWLFRFAGANDADGEERFLRWNFNLQQWWAGTLFSAAQWIYQIKLETNGDDVERGPVIIFIRHTSLVDTLLPSALFSRQQGLFLRYVLKRELLWDPCIDIVGNRLPNAFVERGTGNIAGGVMAVKRLMSGLTERDGILIYPEGTRFTPEKQQRVLAQLAKKNDSRLYEKASALRYVLPPKLTGPLVLLEENENADVVFCAHTGLEQANTARDLFDGKLVGQTIRTYCWRVPFAQIPSDREAQIDWLYRHWAKLDDWVGRQSL